VVSWFFSSRFVAEKSGATCRSWLASEDGITFSIDVDWHTAFAGKPAPAGFLRWVYWPFLTLLQIRVRTRSVAGGSG
jgi:hypothetical protein